MPEKVGTARHSLRHVHFPGSVHHYYVIGALLVSQSIPAAGWCLPGAQSCGEGECCASGSSCNLCLYGSVMNNAACSGKGNRNCNFRPTTTTTTTTTTEESRRRRRPTTTTTTIRTTTTTGTTTSTTTTETTTTTKTTTTTETTTTTKTTTTTTAMETTTTSRGMTASIAANTTTTTTKPNTTEIVNGWISFTVGIKNSNLSYAAAFVQEPNVTTVMRLAMADVLQVNESRIRITSVALSTTRRLSSSSFGEFLSKRDSRELTDFVLTTQSGVRVEFIVTVPPNGPGEVTATIIKDRFDRQSFEEATASINKFMESGMLGNSKYRVNVVAKNAAVVRQTPSLTLAPSQPKHRETRKLIVFVIIAALVCGALAFVSIVKAYLLFRNRRIHKKDRDPLTGKMPARQLLLGEGATTLLSQEYLASLPTKISTECKHRLYEGLSLMLDGDKPLVFISFAIGRRSEDVTNSGPELFYATALVRALHGRGIHCFAPLPGASERDACSTLLSRTGAPCKALIVVESLALYSCRNCLEQIYTAHASGIEVTRLRFEAEPAHGYPYWPGIDKDDTDGVNMMASVVQTLASLTVLPVQLESDFLDDFAMNLQLKLLPLETNSVEPAVHAVGRSSDQFSRCGSDAKATTTVCKQKSKKQVVRRPSYASDQSSDRDRDSKERKTTHKQKSRNQVAPRPSYASVSSDSGSDSTEAKQTSRKQGKDDSKKEKVNRKTPKAASHHKSSLRSRQKDLKSKDVKGNQGVHVDRDSQATDERSNQQSRFGKTKLERATRPETPPREMEELSSDEDVSRSLLRLSAHDPGSHQTTEKGKCEKTLKHLSKPQSELGSPSSARSPEKASKHLSKPQSELGSPSSTRTRSPNRSIETIKKEKSLKHLIKPQSELGTPSSSRSRSSYQSIEKSKQEKASKHLSKPQSELGTPSSTRTRNSHRSIETVKKEKSLKHLTKPQSELGTPSSKRTRNSHRSIETVKKEKHLSKPQSELGSPARSRGSDQSTEKALGNRSKPSPSTLSARQQHAGNRTDSVQSNRSRAATSPRDQESVHSNRPRAVTSPNDQGAATKNRNTKASTESKSDQGAATRNRNTKASTESKAKAFKTGADKRSKTPKHLSLPRNDMDFKASLSQPTQSPSLSKKDSTDSAEKRKIRHSEQIDRHTSGPASSSLLHLRADNTASSTQQKALRTLPRSRAQTDDTSRSPTR